MLGQLQSHSCGHGLAQKGLQRGVWEGQILQDTTCVFPDWGPTLEPSPGGGREGYVGCPLCGRPG